MNAGLIREVVLGLIKLLAPFSPHITEEMWSEIGGNGSVHTQKWPTFDEEAMKEDEVEIVLQINGKVRDRIVVPAEADKASMEKAALAQPKVQQYVDGKTVVKVIAVPGKLVNIVVK